MNLRLRKPDLLKPRMESLKKKRFNLVLDQNQQLELMPKYLRAQFLLKRV